MTRRMLIDATHPEETRVAVVSGTRVEEFDYETEFRKQLKGNIYLAKVTRVEPSLQAAFVEYGGNRHAFLPFPEIHSDYYRIPIGDRPHDEQDGEHGHDGNGEEPLPETAFGGSWNGEASAARSELERDEISEAFDSVRKSYGEDAEDDHHAAHEENGFGSHGLDVPDYDSAPPSSLDDDVSQQPRGEEGNGDDHGSAHDGDVPSGGRHEGDAGPQGEGNDQPAGSSVETVGGDEVDEIRHRRRTQMPRYKIQEVIKRRQIMLIQVSKEERGNKGAAVTTFLSLPGRYCVLMPNTPRGGGVSRKIANPTDRRRMKELIGDLELPPGMSVILRTAGVERSKIEIKRDLDYLMRLWEAIRDLTLRSTAPALVYEEGNLIKRAIRDVYGKEITDILVAGETGYRQAKDFMRMLMPAHARRVQLYRDPVPLFFRFQVESQIDAMHNPVAQLRSGGYIVINQTEALVSIDVNSGRSTRERNIEETAYKTNLEAADEIARQLRLRDMGGLVVVDFIDMEDPRHDSSVERRLKEAMKNDRARIQIGRMSAFGLLELSRQRLHPSLIESNFHTCAACRGTGIVRSLESAAFVALRAIEEEGIKGKAAEIAFSIHPAGALYILNAKRRNLTEMEERYGLAVTIEADESLISPEYRIERLRSHPAGFVPPIMAQPLPLAEPEDDDPEEEIEEEREPSENAESGDGDGQNGRRRRRRRGRRHSPGEPGEQDGEAGDAYRDSRGEGGNDGAFGSGYEEDGDAAQTDAAERAAGETAGEQPAFNYPPEALDTAASTGERGNRRRRGRRGGRRRRGEGELPSSEYVEVNAAPEGRAPFPDAAVEDGDYAAGPVTGHDAGEPGLGLPAGEPHEPAGQADDGPLPAGYSLNGPAIAAKSFGDDDIVSAPLSVRRQSARSRAEKPNEGTAAPAQTQTAPSAPGSLEPGGPSSLEPGEEQPAEPLVAPKRDYEIVNQEPETPRQGWWKRLIQ